MCGVCIVCIVCIARGVRNLCNLRDECVICVMSVISVICVKSPGMSEAWANMRIIRERMSSVRSETGGGEKMQISVSAAAEKTKNGPPERKV